MATETCDLRGVPCPDVSPDRPGCLVGTVYIPDAGADPQVVMFPSWATWYGLQLGNTQVAEGIVWQPLSRGAVLSVAASQTALQPFFLFPGQTVWLPVGSERGIVCQTAGTYGQDSGLGIVLATTPHVRLGGLGPEHQGGP